MAALYYVNFLALDLIMHRRCPCLQQLYTQLFIGELMRRYIGHLLSNGLENKSKAIIFIS